MSAIPPDHQQQLERQPYPLGCSTDVFPLEELSALASRGYWMEAIASGQIAAVAPEHEHFLRVDRGEIEPATIDERAWVRLKGRREYEREQKSPAPTTDAENYGIVEWDKEKCWW